MKITEKNQKKAMKNHWNNNEKYIMKIPGKKWKTLKKKTKPNDKPWKITFKKMEKTMKVMKISEKKMKKTLKNNLQKNQWQNVEKTVTSNENLWKK